MSIYVSAYLPIPGAWGSLQPDLSLTQHPHSRKDAGLPDDASCSVNHCDPWPGFAPGSMLVVFSFIDLTHVSTIVTVAKIFRVVN